MQVTDRRIPEAELTHLVAALLVAAGVGAEDAAIAAEVRVAADLRGIPAHGVAAVAAELAALRSGEIAARPVEQVARETPTSLVLDAGNGLGPPAARRTMARLVTKAAEHGAACGTVRHANDFGIAGAYALFAAQRGAIGIALSNAPRCVAPTFGREPMLGANPLAIAVPTGDEPTIVLDCATSTVDPAAIRAAAASGKPLQAGWAIDADGRETRDPHAALAGALLPIGGAGVDGGGHKGYGLGLAIDILCGVLAGGVFGSDLPTADDRAFGTRSHFFAALRVDGFRDPAAFARDMDAEVRTFTGSPPAGGRERVEVPGEIEHERTVSQRADGIELASSTWDRLRRAADELGVPFPPL